MTRDLLALERLLLREKTQLLSGQFDGLAELVARKAALIERVELRGADLDTAGITRLRELAARNAKLLEAALAGFGAARARVDALQRAGQQLDSYDAHGQARRIGAPAPGVERKA